MRTPEELEQAGIDLCARYFAFCRARGTLTGTLADAIDGCALAALVAEERAEEREACAKMIDELGMEWSGRIAARIRARGGSKP